MLIAMERTDCETNGWDTKIIIWSFHDGRDTNTKPMVKFVPIFEWQPSERGKPCCIPLLCLHLEEDKFDSMSGSWIRSNILKTGQNGLKLWRTIRLVLLTHYPFRRTFEINQLLRSSNTLLIYRSRKIQTWLDPYQSHMFGWLLDLSTRPICHLKFTCFFCWNRTLQDFMGGCRQLKRC